MFTRLRPRFDSFTRTRSCPLFANRSPKRWHHPTRDAVPRSEPVISEGFETFGERTGESSASPSFRLESRPHHSPLGESWEGRGRDINTGIDDRESTSVSSTLQPPGDSEAEAGSSRLEASRNAEAEAEPVLEFRLEESPLPDLGHGIRPLGQIRDSYIVATDEEGLLLLDQHVVHERILFEQFRDVRLNRERGTQPLLIPETLDLSPAEAAAFKVVQAELEEMGIEVMELSGRTIAIKAIPAGVSAGDATVIVRELLSVVERERRNFTAEDVRDKIAAELACKAAIKINMPLSEEKMQWLIDELLKTKNPMTCPHGRPIQMRFGLRDIERGFKRPV